MPGLPIPHRPRGADLRSRRRIGAAASVIAVVAVAVVAIIVSVGAPGSSQGASTPVKSTGATTVQRRDLVATDTESGTLGYANPHTVFNRLTGTITSLPSIGQLITSGRPLFRVDGFPVVLFYGTTPAYRDLSSGVSDGYDIQELNQNLVRLGFDPTHQITVDQTWQAATTAAVERWQAALGEAQTGTVTLGQVVFLPAAQRVTAVNAALGSTGSSGGTSSSGAGTTSAGSSATASGASLKTSTPPVVQFVSLTTTTSTSPTSANSGTSGASGASNTPGTKGSGGATGGGTQGTQGAGSGAPMKPAGAVKGGKGMSLEQEKVLLALLKAETLELQKSRSSSSSSGSSGAGGKSGGGASSSAAGGGNRGGGGASSSRAAGGTGSGSGSGGPSALAPAASGGGAAASGAAGGSAQPILQTTSTQQVVTVNLDATKQAEAVVGEPVTVQLPDGSTVGGKITEVSPVAQSSSAASSPAAGGAPSAPSSTVPVTVTLKGHRSRTGLDQAAVSVNFQQQKATGVLSVPVTALLATAGGGYTLQQATAPHRLIAVTPGLFAAGYVQVSGAGVYPGLSVTDSQG